MSRLSMHTLSYVKFWKKIVAMDWNTKKADVLSIMIKEKAW
jgi:hypothetical protein